MMIRTETPLERARRHVAEAEPRVARQRALVLHLRACGHDPAKAQRLLDTMEGILRLMREHLVLEEEGSARWILRHTHSFTDDTPVRHVIAYLLRVVIPMHERSRVPPLVEEVAGRVERLHHHVAAAWGDLTQTDQNDVAVEVGLAVRRVLAAHA
ncbi:MAG TPA: hypothetical protein VLI21_13385 [Casimicrobiaceae bacterium]|nr:hypothetical protein [Casimicrobiaceae bacterium]